MDVRRFGQYQLEAMLGVGGMGEVYRAYDTQRHRSVAVKLLPDTLSNNRAYQRRFRRESYLAAGLREPHVIPIHDFGEMEGRLYIDMRLVDGESIYTILEKEGPIAPPRAVHLISQIAEALDAAHAEGLVHRDIKPSNILVTATDFVYVVDFGVAHAMGATSTALTRSGAAVGTLDYMAPERFENRQIDGRVDVYSLTCLLHECLTASHPFSGGDLPSLMYAHIFSPPPEPSRINLTVPRSFDTVIGKGMAKDPAARFDTSRQLAEAARAALATAAPHSRPVISVVSGAEEILSRPDGPVPSVVPGGQTVAPGDQTTVSADPPPPPSDVASPISGRRRPRKVALASAAATAVVVVLVFIFVLDQQRNHRAPAEGPTDAPSTAPALADAAPHTAALTPVAASAAVPVVAARIPIGPGAAPGAVAVAPNGRYAYTANRDAKSLSVIDTALNTVTATIPVTAGSPQFVAFAPDGRHAYLSITNSNGSNGLVGVLDTASNTIVTTVPVGRSPYALTVSADGRDVYVPDHDSNTISVISTATDTVAKIIHVRPNPHSIKFSEDGRLAYIANHQSDMVSILDTTSNTVTATVQVGLSPHSIAVAPDQSKVADVNYDGNDVSVIATPADVVTATIPVGADPQDIAFAPDGQHIYVVNNTDSTLSVIDARNDQVTTTIPTGTGPTGVAVLPDGRHAYVTNLDSGDVTVLNTAR
ncbi:MAG: protein kinase domain-containing protein [Pseudonocardiaceae bacterium]